MVVIGFGTGLLTYPINVLAQSCVKHEYLAIVTSAMYTLYRVGWSVGSAVASAVWSSKLYKRLVHYLGDETLAASIYGDPYTFIAEYAWGSPEEKQLYLLMLMSSVF